MSLIARREYYSVRKEECGLQVLHYATLLRPLSGDAFFVRFQEGKELYLAEEGDFSYGKIPIDGVTRVSSKELPRGILAALSPIAFTAQKAYIYLK